MAIKFVTIDDQTGQEGAIASQSATITGSALSTIAVGQLVYFNNPGGMGVMVGLAQANNAATLASGFALNAANLGQSITVALDGINPIAFVAGAQNADAGKYIYLDDQSAGYAKLTPPSASGSFVQR